jgi:hypothetical protein
MIFRSDRHGCLFAVLQFLRKAVRAVELWASRGYLHRDLSLANVGIGPGGAPDDEQFLAWDFATLCSVSTARPEEPGALCWLPAP